jgi:CRP-like cAMP-binding protein
LYYENWYPDELYFIFKGRINFIVEGLEIAYKSYLKGSYVGEIEILKNSNRINTA